MSPLATRLLCLALLTLTTLSAKDYDLCGTTAGRTQQELFLHRRNILGLARAASLRSASQPFQQDFGNIAVMDDSNGVIGRRNIFNLDRRTVSFVPAASGYRVDLAEDTFDTAAAQNATRLEPLADDDTHQITLPFSFRFFAQDYRELWVNSNGTVTFGRGDTDYSGSYGHFIAGPPTISGLFTDLDPTQSAEGVRVLAEPTRVVITWSSVPLASSANFGRTQIENFQIRIYTTGRVEIAFRSANPPDALVGITPGNFAGIDLLSLSSAPLATFPSGVAEVFSSADAVDVVSASQRFYQTHEDSYDYLVFYNAAAVRAGAGSVAYEITTRTAVEGIGDTALDEARQYGSKSRLKAVLNLGPITQYPLNPHGTVASRAPIGDTPVTILAHEAGHLFLALVSVAEPGSPDSTPMLTTDRAHWAFPFNSDGSVMGGERISDRGVDILPRFLTTATVEGYSPLDQYLMGLRALDEVSSTFVVLNSGNATRTPQTGISFGGNRLDVTASAIEARYGRRTPDATVAQRSYRFGFVLIVPAGADSATTNAAVNQVEQYRQEFEKFFAQATSRRATADTALRKRVTLSVSPAAGLLQNAESAVALELETPVTEPLTFTIRKPNNVLAAPAQVTVPPGAARVTFPVFAGRLGVEDLTLEPSVPTYETAAARVQVNGASGLRLALSGQGVRVEDMNRLPYLNIPVNVATASAVEAKTTGDRGELQLPVGNFSIAFPATANPPRIDLGGVVDALTYSATLSPSGYVSIFGSGLENAQITLDGNTIPALYTSGRQVNFRAPANLSSSPLRLSLQTSQGLALVTVTFERNQ